MPKSTKDLEEHIRLARVIAWQDQLDQFTDSSLRFLQKSIGQAQLETAIRLEHWAGHPTPTGWSEDRSHALLDELGAMSTATQNLIVGHIADMAGHAGSASLDMHNDIVSWGGRVVPFNAISLTPEQIKQLVYGTPVGGRLLQDWVHRTFDDNLREKIRQEILTGMLEGNSFPKLIDRIDQGWGMTRTQATTLARTYVQSVNVSAMQAVNERNKDIIKGWKWVATMEVGGPHGGGTCLRCAALDGHVYLWTDTEAPEIPLHPNCRCVPMPITLTWRELGLDINELEDVYRPWTYSDLNIREGRGGKIIPMGFHQGDFGSLYPTLPDDLQKQIVGPGRWQLIKDGVVTFADLVNPATGQLRLLEKVGGKIIGLADLGVKTGMELEILGPAPAYVTPKLSTVSPGGGPLFPEPPPATPEAAIVPPAGPPALSEKEKAVYDAITNPVVVDEIHPAGVGSGINETRFLKLDATDPYTGDKLVGVFKPIDGERFTGVRNSITNTEFRLANRETLAYQVAKQLGMDNLVPETAMTQVEGQVGSMMRLVPETKHLGDKWMNATFYIDEWDGARATLFDYLIGNTDRHLNNALIDKAGKLVLIDHGYSFPAAGFGMRHGVPSGELRIGFLRDEMKYKSPGKVKFEIGDKPLGGGLTDAQVADFTSKIEKLDISKYIDEFHISQEEIAGFEQRKAWLLESLKDRGLPGTFEKIRKNIKVW